MISLKSAIARACRLGGDLNKIPNREQSSYLPGRCDERSDWRESRSHSGDQGLARQGRQNPRKYYDVVWGNADPRKRGANGKVLPVGDTVDVSRATWTNTIGDPDGMGVFKDPDFDPSARLLLRSRY